MVDLVAKIDNIQLYHGRMEHITPHIPENAIDLLIEDPPYFRVLDAWWDRQWDDRACFLSWISDQVHERYRILKKTGSLYMFASPEMSRPIADIVDRWFNVLNEIRWVKTSDPDADPSGYNRKQVKENLRSYWSPWEAIIFAEHKRSDGYAKGEPGFQSARDDIRGFLFEPIRDYIAGEFKRAGVPFYDADRFCGVVSMASRHYFGRSQWWFPLPQHYAALQAGLAEHGQNPAPPFGDFHAYPRDMYEDTPRDGQYMTAQYEYLRATHDRLREEYENHKETLEHLRRPFNATNDLYTDIWYYDHVPAGIVGRHPAQKPLDMIEDIIRASSRPGDLVADFCMGHGTTAIAARNLDRRFIGCDASLKCATRAAERLEQLSLPGIFK